jgi:hypothetical protein
MRSLFGMLKLKEGRIIAYCGHYGGHVLRVAVNIKGDRKSMFYIDCRKLLCASALDWSWEYRKIDCYLDGRGTILYNEIEPNFYA